MIQRPPSGPVAPWPVLDMVLPHRARAWIRSGVIGLVGGGLLGGCAGTPPAALPMAAAPLRVMNGAIPFGSDEGAAARKLAELQCQSRGQRLQSSIYDRYEAGTWVFVEGCA
jgi:hypothetical protein